jgi:poly(3-hydroxybutyrate) depolymerase
MAFSRKGLVCRECSVLKSGGKPPHSKMKTHRRWLLLWLLLILIAPAGFSRTKVESKSVVCQGSEFKYQLLAPESSEALPAVLLLHGAGDSPRPMIDAWEAFAKKEKVVLIAPELPRKAEFEPIAPGVFHCVVEEVKRSVQVDPKRIYVFGNSMGGYLAYDAAMFQSEYFAAVAVHAMGIAPEYDSILGHAKRKIPIAIFMGDRDPLVSLQNVRRTKELLEKNGFLVHYVELKDHDHNYYMVSNKVNADAWKFFAANELP